MSRITSEFSDAVRADSPIQRCPVTHLTVGMFFDGTNNNFRNIETNLSNQAIPIHGDTSSYRDWYTNVAWLYDVYVTDDDACDDNELIRKIYIEGCGTNTGSGTGFVEMIEGKVLAVGDTGVSQRADEAISRLKAEIENVIAEHGNQLKTVTLDVFGFSRGSAAARVFVSRLLGSFTAVNIEFRFMGIFDTVVSISNSQNFISPNHSAKVTQTRNEITLLRSLFKKVFHLCAENEYRKKFSLRSILNQGEGSTSSYEEMMMIGAHADIGGGYAFVRTVEGFECTTILKSGAIEKDKLKSTKVEFLSKEKENEARELAFYVFIRESLIEQASVTVARASLNTVASGEWAKGYEVRAEYDFECKREISPGLSIVALHLMHDQALKANVKLRPISEAELNETWIAKSAKYEFVEAQTSRSHSSLDIGAQTRAGVDKVCVYRKNYNPKVGYKDSKRISTKVPKLDDLCGWYLRYLRGQEIVDVDKLKQLKSRYVHMSTYIFGNSELSENEMFDTFIAPVVYGPSDYHKWDGREIHPNDSGI